MTSEISRMKIVMFAVPFKKVIYMPFLIYLIYYDVLNTIMTDTNDYVEL